MVNKAFIILFLLFSVAATAQTDSVTVNNPMPTYGMKIGMNVSWVTGEKALPQSTYYPGAGVVFGFLASFPINKDISAEVNLALNTKGYRAYYWPHTDSIPREDKVSGGFSYLEVPVMLQYNNLLPSRKVTIVAGLSFAYLIARNEHISWLTGKKYLEYTAKGHEGVSPLVMGVTAGAHLNFHLFRTGIRLNSDITNATKKGRAHFGGPLRFRYAQLELAFLIGNSKPKYTGKPI